MKEASQETWEQTTQSVHKLLSEKMDLPAMSIERAHRVGRPSADRPRNIVVSFNRLADRETTMRSSRKLKGSGIYINDDLCAASQQKKKEQMPMLREARARGKIAYFKHTRLIIRDRQTFESADYHPPVNREGQLVNNGQGQRRTNNNSDAVTEADTGPVMGGATGNSSTAQATAACLAPSYAASTLEGAPNDLAASIRQQDQRPRRSKKHVNVSQCTLARPAVK